MFLVVSQWRCKPGKEKEFQAAGEELGGIMRRQPGVLLVEAFPVEDRHIAVHGYADEAAYNAVVSSPNSPFAKGVEQTRFEDYAEWLGSERGTTVPH